MFVAMVTEPLAPASALMRASRAWFLALSTSCRMPRLVSWADSFSDFSMLTVPTSTGWPRLFASPISSQMAANFSASLRNMRSSSSSRTTGLFVGMTTTSSL